MSMKMKMKIELSATVEISGALEFEAEMRFFAVHGVNVVLMAMSSLDDVTFTPIPGDFDLVDSIGRALAAKVGRLES